MKKKIIQWLIGLVFSAYGFINCFCGFSAVWFFIRMINSTGKESLTYFTTFLLCLFEFLFCTYDIFVQIASGIKDEWK